MKINKRIKTPLSQLQIIAYGYIVIIIIGSILLSTPLVTNSHKGTDFLTALFTATSATCVTGLVLVDTATHWNLFGQIVIMILIQIGGLGFVTIGIFLSLFLGEKINIRTRGLAKESLNLVDFGGVVKLTKKVLYGTFIIESIGAILLSIRFIKIFGLIKGIWYSIFHSISAFCNAGFDLMGKDYGEYSSLTAFSSDILINLIIVILILAGGIGFIVWDDVSKWKFKFKKYRLHSKIVLSISIILIVVPSIIFYFSEEQYLFNNIDFGERILSSIFATVTPRTAGFNTVDTSIMSPAGKVLTIFLMFIGAGSGSTAGGIKITTFFVLCISVYTSISRKYGINAFGRRIDDEALKQSEAVASLNMLLIFIGAMIVLLTNTGFNEVDIIYELTSAISTVGMSTGITRNLNVIAKIVVIILMYFGRVGGLSFALSFTQNMKIPKVLNVKESISIG